MLSRGRMWKIGRKTLANDNSEPVNGAMCSKRAIWVHSIPQTLVVSVRDKGVTRGVRGAEFINGRNGKRKARKIAKRNMVSASWLIHLILSSFFRSVFVSDWNKGTKS